MHNKKMNECVIKKGGRENAALKHSTISLSSIKQMDHSLKGGI
ncbi:MAG: hypothetical protein PWP27_1029 [Clostridiales bacterium]|jgi:hypothetical protein|nr:hypothetical protein [Clostridiales bacterium]MDK2933219.1 hypothetical protein [Clostridiales bacterium]